MANLRAELREFVLDNFLHGEAAHNLADDVLLRSMIIDSLAIMRIVSFVEERTDLEFEPNEIHESFTTIDAIVALVAAR